jgi:hypothetical protein
MAAEDSSKNKKRMALKTPGRGGHFNLTPNGFLSLYRREAILLARTWK